MFNHLNALILHTVGGLSEMKQKQKVLENQFEGAHQNEKHGKF